jgi:hypothetical protein
MGMHCDSLSEMGFTLGGGGGYLDGGGGLLTFLGGGGGYRTTYESGPRSMPYLKAQRRAWGGHPRLWVSSKHEMDLARS